MQVLHWKTQDVDMQVQLTTDNKLHWHLRHKHKSDQAQILVVWNEFNADQLTHKEILRDVSHTTSCVFHLWSPQNILVLP